MRDPIPDSISWKAILLLCIIVLGMLLAVSPVAAMRNPSAVYCTALGYQYNDTVAPDGAMTGYCTLSNNQRVDAWQFFEGKVAQDASYCVKQGYQIRTVTDPAVCPVLISGTCAVCVMKDGSTAEVSKLMNLRFGEKICRDKICCDPDTDGPCPLGGTQPVLPFNFLGILLIMVILVLIASGAFFVMRRKKSIETVKKEK
jgi:putative hemolysin